MHLSDTLVLHICEVVLKRCPEIPAYFGHGDSATVTLPAIAKPAAVLLLALGAFVWLATLRTRFFNLPRCLMQPSSQPAMTAVVLNAAMLLAVVPASAAVISHTGSGTYNYPSLTAVGDSVYAFDTTTVNLLTNGLIGGHLKAYEDSMVNVSGGSIGVDLLAFNKSRMNVSDGSIGDDMLAYDDSTVTVSGGTIGDYLASYSNSIITVSGGSIGAGLVARNNSTLTIIGSGFNFDYGDYIDGSVLDLQFLTGSLADGTALNNQVWIYDAATVTLQQVIPEPSTGLLFLFGLTPLSHRRRDL